MSGRVEVAIVNYNGAGHVCDCLRSLFNQTFTDLSVTVLDNASTDGSAEMVEREFPQIELLRSDINLGFAAGSNAAIRRAIDRGDPEFVFTLNNDVHLEGRCVEALVRAMDEAPAEVWSCQPKIYLDRGPDGPPVINNAGILVWRDGSAYNRGINQVDSGQFDDETNIFGTCAAASLYRRSALEEVGLFDEQFFAYLEDVDLAWRGRLLGYRSLLCPGAVCHHRHGASAIDAARKISLVERNRVMVLVKEYPAADLALSPLYTGYRLLLLALLGLKRKRSAPSRFESYRGDISAPAAALALLRGLWRGFTSRGLLGKRRDIRAQSTLGEREVRRLLRAYSAPLAKMIGS